MRISSRCRRSGLNRAALNIDSRRRVDWEPSGFPSQVRHRDLYRRPQCHSPARSRSPHSTNVCSLVLSIANRQNHPSPRRIRHPCRNLSYAIPKRYFLLAALGMFISPALHPGYAAASTPSSGLRYRLVPHEDLKARNSTHRLKPGPSDVAIAAQDSRMQHPSSAVTVPYPHSNPAGSTARLGPLPPAAHASLETMGLSRY